MKKYIANELRGKYQGEMIIVEAENLEEAFEKLNVDDHIKPYERFTRHYNRLYSLYEEGKPQKELAIIHTADSKILRARKEAGLTLTKMSKLTGIPLRTIQSWESGERHCPVWAQKLIIQDLKGWKESRSIFTDKTIERLTLEAKSYKSDEELKFIDGVGWEDWMEEFEVEKTSDILTGIFREAHQDIF